MHMISVHRFTPEKAHQEVSTIFKAEEEGALGTILAEHHLTYYTRHTLPCATWDIPFGLFCEPFSALSMLLPLCTEKMEKYVFASFPPHTQPKNSVALANQPSSFWTLQLICLFSPPFFNQFRISSKHSKLIYIF